MSFIARWGRVTVATTITVIPGAHSPGRHITTVSGLIQPRGVYLELDAPVAVGDDELEWKTGRSARTRVRIIEIVLTDRPGLAPSIKHAYARYSSAAHE